MKKTYRKLKSFTAFILAFIIVFSFIAVPPCNVVFAAEADDEYITYNKNLYEKNKELCDRIADGMKNFEEQIYIGDFKITSKAGAGYIMKTVIRKHPELFFVDATKYMMGSDGTYIAVICPIYLTDKQTAHSQIDEFNFKVSQYLSKINGDMNEFEKAVVLHDELALNCRYAESDGVIAVSAYDAIVNGEANCQGYSEAYSYLLSLVGIYSEIVESSAMYHIWNKVRIDGSYYNVDLTWDDAVPDKAGHVSHKYFLLSDSALISGVDDIAGHYGFDYAYYKSADKKYDGRLFHEFDTKLCFVGNECYVVDNKYNSKYEKCLLKYYEKSDTADVIRRFDYRWKSGETSYWRGGFMSLDEYGGLLYFNSPDRIYSYHIKNEEVNEFSAVDTSYGDCYGVRVSDGTIYAAVSKTPNEERTLILAGKCPASQDITKPEILLGDVTQDGVISISDATAVQKYSADLETLSENQLIAADFNGDGVINVIDSTAIQKSIAGL